MQNLGSVTFCLLAQGIPTSSQIFYCYKDAQSQPIARWSFFCCFKVAFHWNKISCGVLAVAQSDDDKSNQSCYDFFPKMIQVCKRSIVAGRHHRLSGVNDITLSSESKIGIK